MSKLELKTIKDTDKLSSYWKAEWKVVALIVVTGIYYNAMMEFGPIFQGKIIDLIANHGGSAIIERRIIEFVLLIVTIQFSRFLKRYFVRNFANRTSAAMRMNVYDNILSRSMEELKGETAGDLMTKAISDVGACVEGMRKFTTEIFDTGVLMVAYFVTLMIYSPKLTLCACIFIPLAMFIAERMKTVIYRFTSEYRAQLSRVSEITLENVSNELLYRMNGVSDIKEAEYDDALDDLQKKGVWASIFENSMQPIYTVIALIGIILVGVWGGKMTIDGIWRSLDFRIHNDLLLCRSASSCQAVNSVRRRISWRRINPSVKNDGWRQAADCTYASGVKTAGKQSNLSTAEHIAAADAVTLRVRGLSQGIVEEADFEAMTGQLIGITGPVASGKSTIGAALQGLWPYGGSIEINGRELSDMSQKQISRYITYMGHDSQLLSDTIYNNITLGAGGDVSQVLSDVCFDADLLTMPDGVDTMVGAAGVRLSGGQQARISLARALFNKARILVLDDPFAAVDVETERRITENLRKRYSDCLTILISHRVTAFDQADKVLLVDRGRTTFDTHDALMASSEVYRQIFTLQKEGEDA